MSYYERKRDEDIHFAGGVSLQERNLSSQMSCKVKRAPLESSLLIFAISRLEKRAIGLFWFPLTKTFTKKLSKKNL